ncbi:hypothetical protein AMTR_s00088p00054890 [Amborella trichopoda]|uniref:Uncharacterized protein n=1 Tax=Amborella trichopoda TaxID=13333 RepID=W1NV75_AMBTC|nr:hypothetical protein AMTR_s00088p00054890 [Amborella trichopoda]
MDLERLEQLVVMEEGCMPQLKNLHIIGCDRLMRFDSSLGHLTSLEYLLFGRMPEEFIAKLRRDGGHDHYKIEHIPKVEVAYVSDGRIVYESHKKEFLKKGFSRTLHHTIGTRERYKHPWVAMGLETGDISSSEIETEKPFSTEYLDKYSLQTETKKPFEKYSSQTETKMPFSKEPLENYSSETETEEPFGKPPSIPTSFGVLRRILKKLLHTRNRERNTRNRERKLSERRSLEMSSRKGSKPQDKE